jgi:hypothetical protein
MQLRFSPEKIISGENMTSANAAKKNPTGCFTKIFI